MGRHAAITIVSKNYYSLAKTLAESYKKFHPDHDFLIVLVDRADGYIPSRLDCGAEVVELVEIRLPDMARFIYRYTIMELNTAVKPFALQYFFDQRKYETLLYLDPDILIFRPLIDIYEALQDASIVLTPHTRRPYYDSLHPSDVSILQSGTYNLGFLGLKASESSSRLLEWWMTKLYLDCIVDIPNGLFVDQKWMDMIPGFFPDHCILQNPAYNVAYWNLHERSLQVSEGQWSVDGIPLAFFHFSGYTPFAPDVLSKHQSRVRLTALPVLKKLTDTYGEALLANGYEETSEWPYAFETLPNGVRLPLKIVRSIMQWAARSGVSTPDPLTESDAFCCFLMSRGIVSDHPNVVLLFDFLLRCRHDVAAAYPGALEDSSDEGFQYWVKKTGMKEEKIGDLLSFRGGVNYVADVFARLRREGRGDVFRAYETMWTDFNVFQQFVDWVSRYGIFEMDFEPEHALHLREAVPGVFRILNIYFLRGDLQAAFPTLRDHYQASGFAKWLRGNRNGLAISDEDITLFTEYAVGAKDIIDKARFLYSHGGKSRSVTPNIFAIDDIRTEKNISLSAGEIQEWLEQAIEPVDHFVFRFGRNPDMDEVAATLSTSALSPKTNYRIANAGKTSLEGSGLWINLAGFLTAPSGMGESARSMRTTLEYAPVSTKTVALPHPQAEMMSLPEDPFLFGWPSGRASVSITVANADTVKMVETFLPASYWTQKNVGYWVWETEMLPFEFQGMEKRFDEIWTPSHYSAEAIGRVIDRPVKVLPHTLDFGAMGKAVADRKKFGLPEEAVLFGFIFDPYSVLERKNVSGLITAFQNAFGDDDNCYLVLKVNGKAAGSYDYERVRAKVDCDRIIFKDNVMSREDTFNFMKSLDAYVSLHRSEGFGLTCAEAMALGLPVIASGYSGNLEFMDDNNSLLVPTRVIETDRPFGAYPSGTHWGDPDLDAAADLMRKLQDSEYRRILGLCAAASITGTLAPAKIGDTASQLIGDLVGPRVIH